MANFGFKDPGISQPAFHQYLWDHSDANHEVTVNQIEMGDLLGVTRFTIARHLKEMVQQGRLVKTRKTTEGNMATYAVADPEHFPADPKATTRATSRATYPSTMSSDSEEPSKRQLKWG